MDTYLDNPPKNNINNHNSVRLAQGWSINIGKVLGTVHDKKWSKVGKLDTCSTPPVLNTSASITTFSDTRDRVSRRLLYQLRKIMTEYDLLVVNGLVVTDEKSDEFDVAVKDGKIAKLIPRGSLAPSKAKKVIDAEGGMIMVCRV